MQNSIIFGPVASRRFGISLGIDLSPLKKQCNFDCLYCELKASKAVEVMSDYPLVDEIITQVKKALAKFDNIDVLTVTANGEPTLYPHLLDLIQNLKKIKKDFKLLILSNASTIYKKEIQEILKEFDEVKLSLDCVTKDCFKKLDRPANVNIEDIIKGIIQFSKEYKNSLIIETLFVKDVNNKRSEIKLLKDTISKIKPQRYDIGTIDRPPAYKVLPISLNELLEIKEYFLSIKDINVNLVYKNRPKKRYSLNSNEIIKLINMRALSKDDIENMFDENTKNEFYKLLKNAIFEEILINSEIFYKIDEKHLTI